ncbi:MAG: hypothetical protein ACYC64_02485 [Armatimonadota bacterium]
MRRRLFAIACFVGVVLSNGQWAVCAPSGLNVIPTADVLGKGVMSLETESDGNGRPWGDDCDRFALLQFGVGNGIEMGADQCLNDSNAWINFKWRVRNESNGSPAVALGTQAIADNGRPQPYVVTTKSLGKLRLHTGVIDIDRKFRWMLGMDHPLGGRIAFQADYISGNENSMTYGVAVSLSNSLSLTLAKSVPNGTDTGNGHVVNLAWTMPLK